MKTMLTAIAFAIALPVGAHAQAPETSPPPAETQMCMDQGKTGGMDHSKMQGMDHSKMSGMDHSKMAGMDHSKMSGMDHSKMSGMDHSKMDHSKMAANCGASDTSHAEHHGQQNQ